MVTERKLVLAALALALGALAQRKPAAPEDLWLWRTASDPQVSPDSKWVAYVEEWSDPESGTVNGNVWVASLNGRDRHAFTAGPWRDTSPRWSPDGSRLAWISLRGGKPQIYVRRLNADRDVQLTTVAPGVRSMAWSADGNWIAFVADAEGETAAASWAPPALLPRLLEEPVEQERIFVIGSGGGPPQAVSMGAFRHWGEPAWMPDGRSIVAIADHSAMYSVGRAGGGMKQLTRDPGWYETPLPSPDGSKIAWLMKSAQPRNYSVRHLFAMNADGARVRMLAGALDRDAAHPQWSNDSRTVYFLADDEGSTHVYAAFNDGSLRQATKRTERLRGFSLGPNGRAATVRSTAAEGGDVVTFAVDLPGGVATVASPNGHLLAERTWEAPEEMRYESAGSVIQAWLVKPPHFDASRKYPLLLDIRDSPPAMYGAEFQLRAQIFAARGYVVLCANPRGTPGYGETFGELLRGRHPGDDADDLMRGVEAAVSKGYIDTARMAVEGGVVAAWLIGHTDRFAAAVIERPIVDWTAGVLLSPEGPSRAANWMGGWPWDDPELYLKRSPVFFAANFRTPTLVLAGDGDAQSEELYRALRIRGVKTAMARLGDGPRDRVLALEAALKWMGW
jgi:acylaminoacyl-peptidase